MSEDEIVSTDEGEASTHIEVDIPAEPEPEPTSDVDVHVDVDPAPDTSAIVQIMENIAELRTEIQALNTRTDEALGEARTANQTALSVSERLTELAEALTLANVQLAEAQTQPSHPPAEDTPPRPTKAGGGWLFA